MIQGKLTFLGTGASSGVPLVGCHCPVCRSSSPFNRRLRTSALFQMGPTSLLIDAGPDFRQQALRAGVQALDGVMLTHTHFDHIGGMDDLRIFYLRTKHPLPCLLSQASLDELKKRYYYYFDSGNEGGSIPARFDFTTLEGEDGEIIFQGIPIAYFSYAQTGMAVNGFRFGDLAYVTDMRDYDEKKVLRALKGVRTLVLGTIGPEPSFIHFSFDEAVVFAQKVNAEKTWLTHLNHSVDYEAVQLPPSIMPAYDGLTLDCRWM